MTVVAQLLQTTYSSAFALQIDCARSVMPNVFSVYDAEMPIVEDLAKPEYCPRTPVHSKKADDELDGREKQVRARFVAAK